MRIAVCEFLQESNAFNPNTTKIEDYFQAGLYEGNEMHDVMCTYPNAVGGMIRAIEEAGGEIIPIISMSAQSGGLVEQSVVDFFLEKTLPVIQENLPLDGIFLSLHGATQSTEVGDVCGYILQKVRSLAGENTIISVSTDLHANITKEMVANADYICGYQTYPHVDFYETGYRAAKIGINRITGESNARMAWVSIPLIAAPSTYTTLRGPFGDLMKYAESLVQKGELVDFSIYHMQPWLDVSEGGSSVLTISEDSTKACQYAEKLAKQFVTIRHSFSSPLYTIDEVIDASEHNQSGAPDILVDSPDSPNAGACGDSAALLECLLARKSDVKAALYLNDTPAVTKAFEVGVGNSSLFTIGATRDAGSSQPVTVRATVRSLHDGIFMQEGPAERGRMNDVGKSAVLSIGHIDLLVCGSIFGPGDPQLYRHFGIEPTFYQLVSVKACTSYRAAYEPIAHKIFETDTPGSAAVNLKRLRFTNLPKTFFPFSEIDTECLCPASCK